MYSATNRRRIGL